MPDLLNTLDINQAETLDLLRGSLNFEKSSLDFQIFLSPQLESSDSLRVKVLKTTTDSLESSVQAFNFG